MYVRSKYFSYSLNPNQTLSFTYHVMLIAHLLSFNYVILSYSVLLNNNLQSTCHCSSGHTRMKISTSCQTVLLISLCCPGQILSEPDQLLDARDLDLWPLVTPILGGDFISQECISASLEYIQLLSESLTLPPSSLNDSHRNALKRLDSGGPLPFLEEGILLDTRMTDICSLKLVRELLRENRNITNCYTLPREKRIFGIPYHTAGSPGISKV